MQVEKLRTLIRESIQEYIKGIDETGTKAMYEAKMRACEEAIQERKNKLDKAESLEEMAGLFDSTKLNEIKKEIKTLEKQHGKYRKMLEKLNKGKEKVTDAKVDENTEAAVDEADVTAQMEMKDEGIKEEALNESFLKMQKLAGVITEAQYRKKVQMLSELEAKDVKKGETYMYKWSDKYAPIKVKILGGSSWGDDTFTVEALEDKDGLKQGNQYNAKAEALSPMSVGE